MADPLIIDSDARYTLKHTLDGGHNCDVVLDFSISNPAGTAATRAATLQTVANQIVDGWTRYVLAQLGSDLEFTEVTYTDLDSSSGSTGSSTAGAGTTLPHAGGSASASYPANVAILVHKHTIGGRDTRNGRMFLPGVPLTDGDTDGNGPSAATITAIQNAISNFEGVATAAPTGWIIFFGVAHDKAKTITPVTSVAVDPMYATQKRRLRGR